MRASRALVGAAALVLFVVAGCASGGGRSSSDAGRRPDGASSSLDGGPIGSDAGPLRDALVPMPDAGPIEHDGGPRPDAGVDAGPILRDSGPPPVDTGPPPCTSAAECNDGLACNGVERCELGECVAGAPPTCDDGIACTRDRCVEGVSASCEYLRDDTLCPSGQSCGASGCMTTCGESPCRLVAPQCGCGAGQGCYLNGTTRMCSPAGTAAEGASCTTVASCAPGLACLNIARTTPAVSQCMRFCASDAGCAGPGSLCVYTIDDGAGGAVPGALVCSRSCDPITSAGCTAAASCQVFSETTGAMRYFTDCLAPVGAGGQGAACTDSTQCRRGFICLGTPGICLRYCDEPGVIGGGGCNVLTEACYGFTDPLIVGAAEYGVCDTYP